MVKIQYDKIFQEQISSSFKNIKKEIIKNNDEKNKIFDIKKFSSNNKKVRSHKYFLEGNVIKLYVVENGIKTKCLKRIPLKDASASILAQIENVSPEELRMIVQMQQDGRKKDEDKKNETKEYSIYDTKSYLRNLK
ncbi:hypothetical protein FDC22_04050 [Clostridium botulinum]|uniref:Conserved domain protein n=1 Tax=Clostridium botulinum (strain Okra / Type B1) TaxID=498213 RepID=B1IL76_CLOBK|nr:hypothetical protein [Clostridium botulinum]EKX79725.1 hypothetical protein CFSAN001628_010793 [Clostridium botulinum CFSAN001628]ACA46660.1 conserved domain protein [Clostridium botulinum B1 str. Okra]MBD5563969.1 hypothetical protein [Clostridium botulinum]MBD5566039.1 hypothetical protein [Clostridium botulinum]MBD5569445.1 hypothetical protein [Clostridium botulinum]